MPGVKKESFLPIMGLKRSVQRQPISHLDNSILSSVGHNSLRGSTAANGTSLQKRVRDPLRAVTSGFMSPEANSFEKHGFFSERSSMKKVKN